MAGNDSELIKVAETGKNRSVVKKVVAAAIVLVLGTVGYFYIKGRDQQDNIYLTMAATKGRIVDQVEATGTITPLHEVDLYFKQQGTLKALYVKSGDPVKAGQLLAVQDDTELRAAVEQARSDLLQAQHNLSKAQLEYDRQMETYEQQKALYESGGISESDFKQAKRDLESAAIAVESARISIQTAKAKRVLNEADLANAQLKAPFNGIAAQVNGEVGQDVGNSSNPIFHLISNELRIKAMVNEADIGRVKVGQEVIFTVTSYPNQQFKGTVSWISPQSEAVNNVQMYEVDIASHDMNEKLLAGMSITANIIVNKVENVTVVPTMALTYAQTFMRSSQYKNQSSGEGNGAAFTRRQAADGEGTGQQGISRQGTLRRNSSSKNSNSAKSTGQRAERRPIVVLENGKPVIKWVVIGISDNQNTEIKEGIKPGDQVVIGTRTASETTNMSQTTNNTNSRWNQQRFRSGGIGGFDGPPGMH